jgi:hypothetical protein
MRTTSFLRAGILLLGLFAVGAAGYPSLPEREPTDAWPADASCIPRSECCKVCTKGQACGNSCVSRNYQCHKGRGRACDADEICK